MVRNVNFGVGAAASIPVFTTFAGADSKVANNAFHNIVTWTFNRHQIQGASIKVVTGQDALNGQAIHDNTLVGGAQGGIYSASPRTAIYNNTISQNGRYSNDFGIYLWGNDAQAYNNTITPISGRGIQISGGAVNVNGGRSGRPAALASFDADWDGRPGGLTCIRCTLGKGSNAASDYVTFSFENGGHPVSDVHFQDSAFVAGAAKNSTDMRAMEANRQYAEYFIDWNYTLAVKTASGAAGSRAMVTITDATHKQVFSGLTNASGEISAEFHELQTH